MADNSKRIYISTFATNLNEGEKETLMLSHA